MKAKLVISDLGVITSEPATSDSASDPISTGSGADDGDLAVPASVTAPEGVREDAIVQRCLQVRGVVGAALMEGPLGAVTSSLASLGCGSATLYTRSGVAAALRLLKKYHTAAATISPPPTTDPTAIPASAPAESPPEDVPPSLAATRVLVGPPVAVEQYADPLNEVHVAPLLQHPLPSEHLNWFVVQLPVTAGVRPGGGCVFVKTQFPSA